MARGVSEAVAGGRLGPQEFSYLAAFRRCGACAWSGPRLAAVSSFGMSGTNAHVIVEQPPVTDVPPRQVARRAVQVVTLSGRGPEALRAQADLLIQHVESHSELAVEDVAVSTATTRTHFSDRMALPVRSREELLASLAAVRPKPSTEVAGSPAFLFSGGGAAHAPAAAGLSADCASPRSQ